MGRVLPDLEVSHLAVKALSRIGWFALAVGPVDPRKRECREESSRRSVPGAVQNLGGWDFAEVRTVFFSRKISIVNEPPSL